MILPVTRNEHNKFTVVRVHYTADDDKRTDEWLKEAQAGMLDQYGETTSGWKREYEIDYTSLAGKPFFGGFLDYNVAKYEIKYKTGEYIYRGWDFGYHRPCTVITKLNEYDQWCWIKLILGQDEGIREFGSRVLNYCEAEYPGAKFIDACDTAGSQVSDKSDHTSIEILNRMGVFPNHRKQEIKEGTEIIRQKLRMRVDGRTGLLVNSSETEIIDGFKGGLHYPEVKEGMAEKEVYHKDGYYDHIFDAARYLAVEMFDVVGKTQTNNDLAFDPLKEKYRMGKPVKGEQNEYDTDTGTIGDYF